MGERQEWLEKIPNGIYNAEEGLIIGDLLADWAKRDEISSWWIKTLKFLQWCDSWNYVDNLFSQLKWLRQPKYLSIYNSLYPILLTNLSLSHPFVLRFIILMLARYYPQSHEILLERLSDFDDKYEYYLKMGIAWAISEMFIKNEEKVYLFLCKKTLSPWIFSQTLSKIIQSKQINQDSKEKIKTLKEKA